jgi:hypothetical protein
MTKHKNRTTPAKKSTKQVQQTNIVSPPPQSSVPNVPVAALSTRSKYHAVPAKYCEGLKETTFENVLKESRDKIVLEGDENIELSDEQWETITINRLYRVYN